MTTQNYLNTPGDLMRLPAQQWVIGQRVTCDYHHGEPATITALNPDGGFDYVLDKPHQLGPRHGSISGGTAHGPADGWRQYHRRNAG